MHFDHFISVVFAAYLLENAIWLLPMVGHLHPVFKPQGFCMNAQPLHGAFTAFPKQNDKCPTNV